MIPKIASALLEYANFKNYNVDYTFCENLAWAGLQGTTAYNNDNILSPQRRDDITELLMAEQENEANGEFEPKGDRPCTL